MATEDEGVEMADPFSQDLRTRVIRFYKELDRANFGSEREMRLSVAGRAGVSLSTVGRLVEQYEREGHVRAKPHSGGNIHQKVFDEHIEALKGYLENEPDLTNPELANRLNQDFGVSIHHANISHHLKKAGITRKKKVFYDPKIDDPVVAAKRQAWKKMLMKLAFSCLCSMVFMDETFVRTHMTRTYGRSPRGVRIIAKFRRRAKRYTLIGAMGLDGMKAKWLIGTGVKDEEFETWVEQHLIPSLRPGSIVIWDNLDAHYSEVAAKMLKDAGISFYFQSPYSPDFNPIEKAWSKMTLVGEC